MRALVASSVLVVLSACPTAKRGGVCGNGVTGPPTPNFECTAAVEGAVVCFSGSGWTCTHEQCWSFFLDGPCAPPPVEADAGACTDPCSTEGAERCTGSTRQRCEAGCWAATGVCLDGGVAVCNPGGAPQVPAQVCTADVEGVMICPSGPSSGYGYSCTTTGCWSFFFDGPCAPPYSPPDAGPSCFSGACTSGEVGQRRCDGRVRQECGAAGCWVPVALCSPDGG